MDMIMHHDIWPDWSPTTPPLKLSPRFSTFSTTWQDRGGHVLPCAPVAHPLSSQTLDIEYSAPAAHMECLKSRGHPTNVNV